MKTNYVVLFLTVFSLAFSCQIKGQILENDEVISKCYDAFLGGLFCDDILLYLKSKDNIEQNILLMRVLDWAKSPAGKDAFIRSIKSFSLDDLNFYKTFLEARNFEVFTGMTPEFRQKCIEFLVNYEVALLEGAQFKEMSPNHSPDSSHTIKNSPIEANKISSLEKLKSNNRGMKTETFVPYYVFGELFTNLGGDGNHQIKLGIEVSLERGNREELKKIEGEIRDAISSFLVTISIEKAKEDFGKRFLQKKLREIVESVIEKRFPDEIKTQELFINQFWVQ